MKIILVLSLLLGFSTSSFAEDIVGTWSFRSGECSSKAPLKLDLNSNLFQFKISRNSRGQMIYDQILFSGATWNVQQGKFTTTPGGFCADIQSTVQSGEGTSVSGSRQCMKYQMTNSDLMAVSYGPIKNKDAECPVGDTVSAYFTRVK